jgi:hypothetical protein
LRAGQFLGSTRRKSDEFHSHPSSGEGVKDLDQHWLDTSLAFLHKMKGGKQPFYLYHATRGCHFDNYPSDAWAGKEEV